MGYRSQVAFCIDKGVYLKYETLFSQLPSFLRCSKRHETDTAFYWFFNDIRWYTSNEEIAKVEEFIDLLTDNAEENAELFLDEYVEYGYGFVQIGEDLEHIITRGDYHEYELHVQRRLDTPFGLLGDI